MRARSAGYFPALLPRIGLWSALRETKRKLQKEALMPTDTTIDIEDATAIISRMTVDEVLATISGDELPGLLAWLPMVDLNQIDPAGDFELPGLHKRARAGLGAVYGRNRDNVSLSWVSKSVASSGGYSDSDRKIAAFVDTMGSTWGWQRGCALHVIDGYHLTGGGPIDDNYLLYEEVRGFFGVVTDSEGVVSCLVRLSIPPHHTDEFHPQVRRIWAELSTWLRGQVLEEALSRLD